jgi:hypothetical protein
MRGFRGPRSQPSLGAASRARVPSRSGRSTTDGHASEIVEPCLNCHQFCCRDDTLRCESGICRQDVAFSIVAPGSIAVSHAGITL